ncbi:MAG: energy transducer TonB [Crocinitomicaceae bacterium]|nr:energy transducer TonB [Crocinitomicaceae bacterium]
MIAIGVIIFLTLAISLYDYFTSKDTKQLSIDVNKARNSKYGAYFLQKTYNLILASILVAFLLILGLYVGVERGFGSNAIQADIPKTDTFMLTINAPPIEQMETLPANYKLSGKDGSGAPREARQAQDEVRESNTRKADEGTKSPAEKPKKVNSGAQGVLDFEKELFADAKGNQEREKIRQEAEENRKNREEKKRQAQAASDAQKANAGGSTASKGKTMVNYVLDGRTPHNNDIWNVRNPGYTCGQGMAGEVVVRIRVNTNGNVVYAKVINDVSGLNPCLIQQAEAYAKKSRFNPSAADNQEGTITYRFVP